MHVRILLVFNGSASLRRVFMDCSFSALSKKFETTREREVLNLDHAIIVIVKTAL